MTLDSQDKDKIKKIIEDRRDAHKALLEKSPAAYGAFVLLEKAAYTSGTLEKVAKELIAIGISVVTNCESCMEWHIHQALQSGASAKEILEAIDVAIEMGGGPATVSARFALKVLEYHHPAGVS